MLPRAQRKRTHREPIRRYPPVIYDFFPDDWEDLQKMLEDLRNQVRQSGHPLPPPQQL